MKSEELRLEVREKSLVIIKRHLTGPPLHPLGLSSRPANQLAGGDIAPQSPFVAGTHFDLEHQTGGVVVVGTLPLPDSCDEC